MGNLKRKEIFILLFCLLIGFALRFYTFDQKSLWIDEVHTFNESRDDLKGQLKFYKENPTHLHPPFFFILTHLFYPFEKPERDLRIIPLIFGTLSIPMFHLLARQFSPSIAFPCTLSLVFMTYHISLSQEGRSYALLMFLGMAGLYFFMKHLQTSKKLHLLLAGLLFAISLHTSYSAIPFVAFSQILWFYRPKEEDNLSSFSSFAILNGSILFFCLPWLIFIGLNYRDQPIMDPLQEKALFSFWGILYGVLHDWVPHIPLMIVSVLLLILFFVFSENRKNAFVFLGLFIVPIGGFYLYCKLFNITHFVSSRYFINFLPLFFITLYLSIHAIENRIGRLRRFIRLRFLFIILLVASNGVILPLYYRSEKQDLRGLVNYLKLQLRDGDEIIITGGGGAHITGLLHYFGVFPTKQRHHFIPAWKVSEEEIEARISMISQNKKFIISYSEINWIQRIGEGRRLWLLTGKVGAQIFKERFPFVFKAYFDGSFLNFDRFPHDASMYLFLWDPKSPGEKGIDLPIE